MTIYFSSDSHYGHALIIKHCKRPFISVQEMNEAMIMRWNAKVRSDDTVYHLGDFMFYNEVKSHQILSRLNGQKILIFGNHDKTIKNSALLRSIFVKCCDYLEVNVPDASAVRGQQLIVMSHYAFLTWNKARYCSWHLHGHSHGGLKYPFDGKILDVGVDAHDYTPISYDEVKQIMSKKTIIIPDNHYQ